MKSPGRRLPGLLLAATWLWGGQAPCPAESATVTFDLATRRALGGETSLQREKYFNIHSDYDAADLTVEDLDLLVNGLGVGFGRNFSSPFYFFQSRSVPYPSPEQLQALRTRHLDSARAHALWRFRTPRRVITEHPSVAFSMSEDPATAAAWAADFFEHMYTDEDRPAFYEPLNEPFVHAHAFGENEAEVREKMTRFYRAIGEAFDVRGLSTKVVGYASAWPSMEIQDFKHWRERMGMFMDVAGDAMDGFSVHLYDGTNVTGQDNRRSGSNAEAILDLIETYSVIKWGTVKPHAITEYGDIPKGYPEAYSDEKSSQELNALNHLLFTFLDRQDRIDISIPFITSKSPWHYNIENGWQPYSADLWRPDPGRIQGEVVLGFLPTMKMRFYELWAGVQGERVVAFSDDPDIRVQAFVDEGDVRICLNNLDDRERSIVLHPGSPLPPVARARIKRLRVERNRSADYVDEPLAEPLTGIRLAPHETVVLWYALSSPVAPAGTVDATTHHARTYLQPIVAEQAIDFAFPDVPAGVERAMLRMGLGRKHELSKEPDVRVNGSRVPVPGNWPGYDQANRRDFFGAIEIPVPAEYITPHTEVKLVFPDTGGHVSSLCLVTETPVPVP